MGWKHLVCENPPPAHILKCSVPPKRSGPCVRTRKAAFRFGNEEGLPRAGQSRRGGGLGHVSRPVGPRGFRAQPGWMGSSVVPPASNSTWILSS